MSGKLQEILDSGQAPGVIVRGNIRYRSPITGEGITTHAARRYDLESHNCVDAREGREMAADARRYRKADSVSLDDVKAGAERLGLL